MDILEWRRNTSRTAGWYFEPLSPRSWVVPCPDFLNRNAWRSWWSLEKSRGLSHWGQISWGTRWGPAKCTSWCFILLLPIYLALCVCIAKNKMLDVVDVDDVDDNKEFELKKLILPAIENCLQYSSGRLLPCKIDCLGACRPPLPDFKPLSTYYCWTVRYGRHWSGILHALTRSLWACNKNRSTRLTCGIPNWQYVFIRVGAESTCSLETIQ